ncbi:hypothetical protein LX73_2304 [Fodinibius salinus]|uniref:Uncharacterized protein n=1 Tax=Fodinibius salinus TaxID=860790 RepID=A0A5D3YG14_9BACT|nr:hypothetical protein [Fodinibius salinus]TYP92058.1 hypothetical protein LX73_2304 [Fodinibius salinus]
MKKAKPIVDRIIVLDRKDQNKNITELRDIQEQAEQLIHDYANHYLEKQRRLIANKLSARSDVDIEKSVIIEMDQPKLL